MEEQRTQRRVKSRRATATQLRRRQLPSATSLRLSVTLSIPQHVREKVSRDWIIRISTKALLLHLLYARGICPSPATEALRLYQESNAKANPVLRKLVKFGASLQKLLDEWTILSCLIEIQQVIVTLGPSWSRHKEIHVLDFCGVGKDDDGEMTESCLGQEHALSRHLVRALLNGISDQDGAEECLAHPSPVGSSYQAHVSVWITHEVAHEFFEKSRENQSPRQTLSQSLIVRQDYYTTQQASKRTQPHIVTTKISSATIANGHEWKEEEGIWISLPTSIKGFRL